LGWICDEGIRIGSFGIVTVSIAIDIAPIGLSLQGIYRHLTQRSSSPKPSPSAIDFVGWIEWECISIVPMSITSQ
jgi:predicted DNA-binding transcriptional regulator AlpA